MLESQLLLDTTLDVPPLRRISTGNAQADTILGGGLPANSITILMGHPGTGKTLFAEQLLFHNASPERPALYITTLSEPLSKVVTYLQHFSFYDQNKLGTCIQYEDAGESLSRDGVGALLHHVREAILTQQPAFVVIDSFKAVHDLAESVPVMRRLVSELAGLLSAYQTTTILVGEYAAEHIAQYPEFAVADGIISMERNELGIRDERFMRVLKLRGSAYLEGTHAFRITPHGLDISPRLVTPQLPPDYEPRIERASTGVPGLDRVLDGGLWSGTNSLALGAAGSGKTSLGLAFAAAGIAAGERALFLNFQENPTQLARTINARGFPLKDLLEQGLFLRYASPVELQIDSILDGMFRLIEQHDIRRVVIDGLTDLALAASDSARFHNYLYALVQQFAARRVTSMMTVERSHRTTDEWLRISSVTDVIIELAMEVNPRPRRTLRVQKARGIAHDMGVHEFVIGHTSLDVLLEPRP